MWVRTQKIAPQVCPACERYIGPAAACPYCGCDAAVPPAIRMLRGAAVLLATFGLLMLYVAARSRALPAASAGSLSPRMNYASVRMCGNVTTRPYIGRERGAVDYLSFCIHDGTGAVRVQAFDRVARDLAAKSRLPEKGQRVRVTGSLKASADGETRLRLRAVSDLVVEAGAASAGDGARTDGDG